MILEHKGIQVFYTDQGYGKPIVLLHGFLESSNMWTPLIPDLLKTHRVISIDLLGHGQTGCLGYVHSMELMAETVDAVLIHLNIESKTIIGHSMGGYVALAMAEKNPNSMQGLCLMNSTFLPDSEERKMLRTRANLMAQTNFDNLVRMSFTNLFSLKSKETHKQELEIALTEALKTSVQGYMAANEGMKLRTDKTQLFRTLPTKKLLIIGKKDPILDADSVKKQLKGTDVDIVELTEGHMSHIENKEELTYNIMRFIEK
ncbi:MAG: alpha/beta hydrolase [Xanthomarina sp.]|uniref:Alpha/beta hydrolase n=2 Tax=Xanthomarina TaxID=1868329 RepID=A0A3D6BMU8_9FLAO|nr:alpha/beta hydrolase [Xanthomarina sp.]MBF60804.1 alpha/beta hydrolase [Xanthomarina sp.]HAB27783.1 alpha/beta hydrolase [Xanthomarina gelatinilytica]HCY80596.1 alpha/beta hydrolase [Xanthomarina gelatinilytica]